jgi:hypothetical protein
MRRADRQMEVERFASIAQHPDFLANPFAAVVANFTNSRDTLRRRREEELAFREAAESATKIITPSGPARARRA